MDDLLKHFDHLKSQYEKISWVILATLFLAACNNSADSDKEVIDADSFNTSEKKELNNRNTGAYDSAEHGDISSYELMPNKVTDSVRGK